MKVIDLLNKIANGEEVPLIKYRGKILHWNKEKDRFEDKDGMNTLYEMDFSKLNDEVEIKEDKKIEKLETYDIAGDIFLEDCCFKYIPIDKEKLTANEQVFVNKINKIIDYINGGTNGE